MVKLKHILRLEGDEYVAYKKVEVLIRDPNVIVKNKGEGSLIEGELIGRSEV